MHSLSYLSTQLLTCSALDTVPADQQAWGSSDTLQQQAVGTERENSVKVEMTEDVALQKLVISENSGPLVSPVVNGLASLLPAYTSQPWSLQ